MIFFIICAFELITQQKIEKISFFNNIVLLITWKNKFIFAFELLLKSVDDYVIFIQQR